MTNNSECPNVGYSEMPSLTPEEFQAMVQELKEFACANPLNVLERLQSDLGVPEGHRREFRYRDQIVCVMLTEDILGLPGRPLQGTHLSIAHQAETLLPDAFIAEILEAFYPGKTTLHSVLQTGLVCGKLLIMPSFREDLMQFSLFSPKEPAQ